jgi:DNA repair exonuclease SbcCD ATPase subunit
MAEREAGALLSAVRELERQEAAAVEAKAELASLDAQLVSTGLRAACRPDYEAEVERLRGLEKAHIDVVAERTLLAMHEQTERRAYQQCLEGAEAHGKERTKRLERIDSLLQDGSGECDRCGQPVMGGALAAMVASVDAEAVELAATIRDIQADGAKHWDEAEQYLERIAALTVPESPDPATIEAAETNLANARIAETEAARLAGRVESLRTLAAGATDPTHQERLTRAREAHTEATGRLVGLSGGLDEAKVQEMAKDTLGAEVAMTRIDDELAAARVAHGTATERARALAEIAALNEAAVERQAELRFTLDVLRELEKAYGRAGIPVLLLESLYVPQIEKHTNDFLAAWGVPYTVELVTQKEQKTTDRLRDTCEVVIHSPDGARRYQTYSGGEKDRIGTSLRVGLIRTIASHSGHALEVFALDELAHLDAAGVEKLAELLAELQREIPVILFISHDQDLSDAFDQRVVVVREGGRSRLEVAA